jgi:CBS domain-containing protein
MQIREMMTKQVEVLPPHASIRDAAAKMRDLDVGGIPICDGQKLQGFLTDRDLAVRAVAEARDPANTKVSEVMSPNITYCFEDNEVEEAAQMMESKQIRRLPIVDRDKRLVGIVSLGDIAVRSEGARRQDPAAEALEGISEPSRPKR